MRYVVSFNFSTIIRHSLGEGGLSTFLFGSNVFIFQFFLTFTDSQGGLAQLARACDWQSQGREFDSPNLHINNQVVMKIEYNCFFYLNTQMNTLKPI